MENSVNFANRLKWIDGIKFLACIGVFLYHFSLTFFTNTNCVIYSVPKVFSSAVSFFSILLSGNFWVIVFCILSGYLAGKSSINSVNTFIKKTLIRYLRFVIPLLSVSFIIWLISVTVKFYHQDYGVIFQNDWLTSLYSGNITFVDIIKTSFLFDSKIDNAMWSILPIFIGNILTYIISFLKSKFKIRNYVFYFILIALILISFIFDSSFIYSCACIVGAFIDSIADSLKKINNKLAIVILLIVCTVFHFHNDLVDLIVNSVSPALNNYIGFLHANTFWYFLYAFLIVLSIYKSPTVQKIFESPFIQKISSSSFYIFLFHCPVIFSISFLAFGTLIKSVSFVYAVSITLLITCAVLFILVFIYLNSFEKINNIINQKIKKYFNL